MNVSTYIAKRFLLGERGVGASRFTGLIAIAGMAVGCFALILSIAVLNGFEKKVTAKIRGFEGDLRVSGASLDFIDIQKQLDEEQSVLSYMPFMERKGLVIGDGNILRIATLKAVDMNKTSSFYQLGLNEIELNPSDFPVIIGQLLASRLNLAVGDYVKLMSPVDHPSRFGLPRKVQVKVVGVFQGNVLDYDDRLVFVPLSVGKFLFTRKKGLDGVDIRLTAETEINMAREWLLNKFPHMTIESWENIHEGLFQAMRMERIGAIAVLSLIILVASFNLTSTLVLVTIQRIREIGILRAVGATTGTIRSILIKQGFMIGGIGAAVGLGVSFLVVIVQVNFGLLHLPEDIYFMKNLPMILTVKDVILVPFIAIFLISISSGLAAQRAVLIQPKDAIYMEK